MALPHPRPDWALFLDFDGTLVEIADTPGAIVVDPGLPDLLRRLGGALDGALAVVSGRQLGDLDGYLEGAVPALAGLHGWEHRSADGTIHRTPLPETELGKARAVLRSFADEHPGVLLEDKGGAIGLHYRLAPQHAAACEGIIEVLAAHSAGVLNVQRGKMVCELKADGRHKGEAVSCFMAEPPFAGRVPVFVGDDVTDEDGFRAANARGGTSIRVGGRRGSWLEALPGRLARLSDRRAGETTG
jgi:trehalose 6-phosphate phosphatase